VSGGDWQVASIFDYRERVVMFHKLVSRYECVECYVCGQAWDHSVAVWMSRSEPQDFDCSFYRARCLGSDMSDPDADHTHYWDANGRGGAECAVCGFDADLGSE
jgi:hypothetical protein